MKELTVVIWDDLHRAAGERVPADVTIGLVLGDVSVELDLTAEHAEGLEQMLAPYLEAGQHLPDSPAAAPRAGSRAYYRAMREFGDAHGFSYSIGKRGKLYHPVKLRRAYSEYLEKGR